VSAAFLLSPVSTALAADSTVVTVDGYTGPASGPPPAPLGGASKFTGIAVDCTSGKAATRVAVYEGKDASGSYLADASIDTVRDVAGVCTTTVPSGQHTGFTLIYDTDRLANGPHTLTFVAQFPGGAMGSATIQVVVYNGPPVLSYPTTGYVTLYGPGGNSTYVGSQYITPWGPVVYGNAYSPYVVQYGAPNVAPYWGVGAFGYPSLSPFICFPGLYSNIAYSGTRLC